MTRARAWEPGQEGVVLDACPPCSCTRFAALVAGAAVPPSREEYRLLATIGEAAERDRRRREGEGA
jgi:hypothetical protein